MNAGSPALSRIANGDLCAGCGLCGALAGGSAIEIAMSPEGFLRPRQLADLSADTERLIEKTCPGLGLSLRSQAPHNHRIWGPYHSIQTGHASDAALRRHASSGGALSAVLGYLLESGTVDAVVQTAASAEKPIANATVVSRNRDDIYRAAGSRYAPSAPLADLRVYLDRQERCAFVGKPCDVAALRALGRLDERVDRTFPVMISFFCAGVPSQKGAQAILAALDVPESDVAAFRYRGDGWPGYAVADLSDGQERRMSYADSWGGILSKHVQFRCKICADGVGSFADIVCADAWHCDENGYPLFEEEDGKSLVIARTGSGASGLAGAVSSGHLVAQDCDIDEIDAMQPGQLRRKRLVLSRLAAMAMLAVPRPRYGGLDLWPAARTATIGAQLRSFAGMLRRLGARRFRSLRRPV